MAMQLLPGGYWWDPGWPTMAYDGEGNLVENFNKDAYMAQRAAQLAPSAGHDGLTAYKFGEGGQVSLGLRGAADNQYGQELGGENASWVVNPATGKEEIAFRGPGGYYLASDLVKKYGSLDAVANMRNPTNAYGEGGDQIFNTEIWGARPSNDTFSGKDGLADLIKIAAMAAPVGAGAAGLLGAGSGAGIGAAGTADFGAVTGAASGAGTGAALGTGLNAIPNTSGVIGTGGLGTAGTTATALGEGALGSGLAVPGGVGTGAGAGAAGLSGTAAAGSALAPGYFAAEGALGTGGAAGAGTGGTGALSTLGGSGALEAIARGLPGALGALGAANQANAYKDLSRDYMAVGAPSRARFEASFDPGFSMENDPGYQEALKQAAKATLHGLSIGGNPAGSPNAWAQSLTDLYQKTAYPALQNYRNQNASAGGMGALTAAAPAAASGSIAAQGNVFNGIGAAANDIFNPPKSLSQLLREIRSAGY